MPFSIGDYAKDIECSICLEPWMNPIELMPCKHTLCTECVKSLVACPECRQSITSREVPNRALINICAAVTVTCDTCGWAGTRETQASHVRCFVKPQPPQQKTTAEENRVPDEQSIAKMKRAADRCAELLKSDPQFPLHQAADVGDSTTVLDHLIVLLKHDVNSKDGYGNTPLHWAASSGHTNIVEHLLSKGAEVNSKAGDGRTPLHWAALHGHRKTVVYLLGRGAEVNSKTLSGSTPLLCAASNGHTSTVEYLLNKGAEVNSKGDDGWTPLRYADQRGHCNVVELLRSKGGKRS